MTTLTRLAPGLLLLLAACGAEPAAKSAPVRLEFTRVLMGAPARVVLYADDESGARAAGRAALDEIARLEAVMSDYDPESELMQLLARAGEEDPVPVGRDLWDVLSLSLDLARRTGGAFDPTVGPYVRLWRESAASGSLPTPADLASARALVGWARIELHPRMRGVRLPARFMRLDFGAVGKGYAAQAAWALLAARGFPRCLVDLGGDIVAGRSPPGEAGWRVQVLDGPVLRLVEAAVATSGDTARFVEIDGVHYSHIVDPRTGRGLTHRLRVTVVARDAATADALATAVSVEGKETGLARIEATQGAEAILQGADGTRVESSGFSRWLEP